MRIATLCAAATAMIVACAGTRALAADTAHGQAVFKACAACHTNRPDALGPNLIGIVGRKSGSLEDFRYSNAMKRANLTWNEANLKAYLRDPQAEVKGNRMPFSGLDNPQDIDDVVAYLATLK